MDDTLAPQQSDTANIDTDIDSARAELRRTFGFDDFRGKQSAVVERVLAGRSTLAVMPTGAGKSLTYQFPPPCCGAPVWSSAR